jgi:hypothetical protein
MFSQQQQAYTRRTAWERISWGALSDDIDPIHAPQQYPADLLLLALRTLQKLSVCVCLGGFAMLSCDAFCALALCNMTWSALLCCGLLCTLYSVVWQVSDHSSLLVLVHRTVIPFLYVDNDVVREEAARTAAMLTVFSAKQCSLRR